MSENRTRFRLNQNRAPIYEALEQFRKMRVVPFDVPGHKGSRLILLRSPRNMRPVR